MTTDSACMQQAKAQFTRAAQAVLDGRPDAERLCTEALAAIAAARAAQAGGGRSHIRSIGPNTDRVPFRNR